VGTLEGLADGDLEVGFEVGFEVGLAAPMLPESSIVINKTTARRSQHDAIPKQEENARNSN
jgi:hypothetical protein